MNCGENMEKSIQSKMSNSLKWSTTAEVAAKIITPITNMILARLLTPEAFGVVATVTMVISIADMFSDSGFQKYLVQHEFDTESGLRESANVAFTSNIVLSLILWALICLFDEEIASLVGNPGLGIVIAVAGISLPVTSFSSIQAAIFRRKFNYKVLCFARIIAAAIPLIITVPLAIVGWSYWSIIIGTICGHLTTAVILTVKSDWKPKIHFSIDEFEQLFSFSMWSLLESIGTWLSSYIGTFIVGGLLSQYYLGLYKTTMTTVNGIFAIITSATTTVLFSSLSRLQNNRKEYDDTYTNFIGTVSIVIIPLGIGIYVYRELVTQILLGSQWTEAVPFVCIYGLMCCFTLVLGQYASEYFRGLGKPKANVLMTILHLVALIPALLFGANHGFLTLAYARSLVKIEQVLVFWAIMWIGFKFNPLVLLKKIIKPLISGLVMGAVGYILLNIHKGMIMQVVSVVICIFTYFLFYIYILKGKKDIVSIFRMFTGKNY